MISGLGSWASAAFSKVQNTEHVRENKSQGNLELELEFMLYRSFLNGLIKINWTVFSKCAYPGPISRDSLRLGGVKCLFFLKNLLIVLPINTADSEHSYGTSLAVQWLRPCFHYRGHRFLLVEVLRSYKPCGQNRKKKNAATIIN